MLANLTIKNYALIDDLRVNFTHGFTVITGETGAGKSILLGALSLVLGKRADMSSLRDKSQKCLVEAEFNIEKYNLNTFFAEKDLEYEDTTIIRREILPSGKSRAFINDSPVTLDVLSELGNQLIDVHSQHQSLQLAENDFQLKLIDALAGNQKVMSVYTDILKKYNGVGNTLRELEALQKNSVKELDYNSFLLEELEKAPLTLGVQEELESQYEQMSNAETIVEEMSKGLQLLNDDQVGILSHLTELKQIANKLANFGTQYNELNTRILSAFIEIDDVTAEWQSLQENIETDPKVLEEVNDKLQLLYGLQKKHGVNSVADLLVIKADLSEKIGATLDLEAAIHKKQQELVMLENELEEQAMRLRSERNKVIPELKMQLENSLDSLGMPNARFKIELQPSKIFKSSGKDELLFIFSANKGTAFGELKKVASGGELSRIMLTIKAILGTYENLPTMMFDEIDTGVSGEISNRMGTIMHEMSSTMQVFSITHLPQVASKGDHHYKVFKDERADVTSTKMRKLNQDERVVELAEMLGGKTLSDSAMAHARQLLD